MKLYGISNKYLLTIGVLLFILQSHTHKNTIKTNNSVSKNHCTIIVKTEGGSAAEYVRVVGQVCGGIACSGMTKKEYTDDDGVAVIKWSSGCKLCYIYIDGKKYEGDYEEGETYTFIK